MKNIHQDLRNLFVEIPEVSTPAAHQTMGCILIIYSKLLANMFQRYHLSEYFSNLHTMCYDIKAIQKAHVNESHKMATFNQTRAMLIQDMYRLIQITGAELEAAEMQQAQ